MPTPAPKRKRKARVKSGPEGIITAIQSVAVAALGAYRVLRPHVKRLRKKGGK